MSLFSKNKEPEQPTAQQQEPKPDASAPEGSKPEGGDKPDEDRVARLEASLERLSNSVGSFVDTATTPQHQPQQSAPELPPIQDINDDEYRDAMEEGGSRAVRAAEVRRKADQERLRRELGGQVNILQSQGVGAINQLTSKVVLGEKDYYKTDPAIKKDVDAQLKQLPAEAMMNPEAIEYVYNQVVGRHSARLMEEQKEAVMRQSREEEANQPPPTPARRALDDGRELPEPEQLAPNANDLLASRRKGRGQTADEFVQDLPVRQFKDTETGKIKREAYKDWGDYMAKHVEAQDEYEQQQAAYYGR